MTTYAVGKPYHPGRSQWPDCTQYNYRGGQHELLLFLRSPTPAEVKAAHRGRAELALYVEQPVIVLCHRFVPGLPWSDSPFSWHLVPESERDLPSADLEAGLRVLLHIMLVDAATGLVRAIRVVSMSHDLTMALHRAIRDQASAPWSPAVYDAALAALYARFASSEALAMGGQVRCVGGA